MNKAGYAYAVAAVRARTERLFSAEEAAWLWTADEPAVKRALQNKGWQTDRPAEEMARARRQEAWAFITSIAPDAKALHFLLMPEEFCNVFLCTAWQMSGGENGTVWALPCLTPPGVLTQAAKEKDERRLPGYLQKSAQAAWQPPRPGPALMRWLQREKRAAMIQLAEKSGSPQLSTLARAMAQAEADKALFFGAVYEQDKEELLERLGPGGDNARAIEAAVRGPRALCAFWQAQDGEKALAAETMSPAVFEAWRDGQVLKTAWMLARDSFSPAALAAYWLQTKAETQEVCLRLLPGEPAHMRDRGRLQYA